MKPRTKLQKEVDNASKLLPPISKSQEQYAYKHCLDHIAKKTSKSFICLDCGHEWSVKDMPVSSKKKTCICPKCKVKLEIQATRKQKFEQNNYYGVITRCGKYQVVRLFMVRQYIHLGRNYNSKRITEVVQRWITPNGDIITRARLRLCSIIYNDIWNYCSPLEIRAREIYAYGVEPSHFYPRAKYIPEVLRNGFSGNFYNKHPVDFLSMILKDSMAETLLKAGQVSLLQYYINEKEQVREFWGAIKICMRNNYIVKLATMWIDYLQLLAYFGKDLHNAKYVCPVNLQIEHDRLVKKKNEIELKNERYSKALKYNRAYKKEKKRFFDIHFKDGIIDIVVIKSIEEFIHEGTIMKHCVFSNEYYKKKDSLLLSARIDNYPIETIEVSLSKLQILQARGKCNQLSEYHSRILKLVNSNMHKIRKKLTA